jgi:hypothetical protein
MARASWKDINGKRINFKTKERNIFEAIVIADPEVGVSVKPFDLEEVLSKEPDSWGTPPSDPDFFFACTTATKKTDEARFDFWVETLAQDKECFTREDLGYREALSAFSFGGGCPFSL